MARKQPLALRPLETERLERASTLAARAPRPARVGRVRFGTAGWTDRTLLASGLFYPRGKQSSEARLRFYAEHFSLVEVDATYYALLPPQVAEHWVQWTPPDFEFHVKAFPVLTGHPIDVARLPADLREACRSLGHERRVYPDKLPKELALEMRDRFLDLLQPLWNAQRLAAVLMQFPPWFTATRANVKKIEALREQLPALPMSVEFRHPSWVADARRARVLDMLRAAGMSYVCIDAPGFANQPLELTHEPAVIRFHGHAPEFQRRGAQVHERFDYLYDPAELAHWVEPLRELERRADDVHAIFNNCVRNYAVLNAQNLAALLEAE